jgi:hypothetical protein
MRFRIAAKIALAWAFLWVGGAAALAQEPQSGGELVGEALDALHLRAEPAPAPDFVEKARPDRNSLDYKQMAPTDKSSKKKTPAELDALGSDLERALEKNRRAAARVKIPDAPGALAPHSPSRKSKAPGGHG